MREDLNPFLARIIIADKNEWAGNVDDARKLLEDICQKWPKGKKVKFIITCGGFIQFGWPKSISRSGVGDNKYPKKKSVDVLVKEAEKCVKKLVLDYGLDEKLKEFTDYITLGVDSYAVDEGNPKELHIELVFLIDLRENKIIHWTGKSYPLSEQQNGLVRISNLKTHFLNLGGFGKLMILGCNDLTIFNSRSKNAKGWRKKINKEFKKLAKQKKPICVLQHPHTTVKIRTWLNAWSCLAKLLPSVKQYAGAGRYFEPDHNSSDYDALDDVLKSTKFGNTIDFIVSLPKISAVTYLSKGIRKNH